MMAEAECRKNKIILIQSIHLVRRRSSSEKKIKNKIILTRRASKLELTISHYLNINVSHQITGKIKY